MNPEFLVLGTKILGVVTLLALIFAGLVVVARTTRISPEGSRKLAHIGVGLVALSFGWLFESTWPVLALSLGGLLFTIGGRRWTPIRRLIGPVLHGVPRSSLGDYCLPLVVPVLHGAAMPDRLLYAVPILVLTLGDAAAALVGTRYGQHAYRTDEGSKTLEGSMALAGIAGVVVVAALLLSGLHPVRAGAIAATIALLAMLAEAICWRGLDNLVLPLGTYALLRIYIEMPAPMVATRLAVGAVLVVLAIVWHRRAGLIGAAGLAAALILYASWTIGGWLWMIPPLGVLAALPFISARPIDTRDQDHGVGAVLSLGAAPLLWLFLHAAEPGGTMLLPFVASCCGALGVIGVVRWRYDRAMGRLDPWLAPKALGVAIAIGVVCAGLLSEQSRSRLIGLSAIGALLLGATLTLLSPAERRPNLGRRWLTRAASVILVSLAAVPLSITREETTVSRILITPATDGPEEILDWTPDVPSWPEVAGSNAPDERAVLADGSAPRARASLWRMRTAAYRGVPTVYVGHLAAADPDSMRELLDGIVAAVAPPGPCWLLGPIDGSTWHRYRAVIEDSPEPTFPLEPTNPLWWSQAFGAAGFEIVERYWSASREIGGKPAGEPPPEPPSDPPPGIRIRSLDADRLEQDMASIYDLAVQAFAANPLYTPIMRDEFTRMYAPIACRLHPDMCLIADDRAHTPVGVMFSMPADERRLVLKSLAVSESVRGKGLGSALLAEAARRGARNGFERLVFALMHEHNASSRMVSKIASPCRAYALFGRPVGS